MKGTSIFYVYIYRVSRPKSFLLITFCAIEIQFCGKSIESVFGREVLTAVTERFCKQQNIFVVKDIFNLINNARCVSYS